ncbi:MAG TPA: NAD(P)H-dependent glycerol-3-phosphate dehydrogenase [Cyanobacteria bacterium UBA11149]|nr:NAD(P)H-dependent glycerol-3-phosphate dehydrogenase [Cyanobacteria bacterium UBA11367]HBE59516.1 NAD(P)H-dependent glycerol-3-phosphate dehydrogenase [Cyanobacteria bacterium UBA11366]HBK66530.1 NAD(P)H-dependent glycerol-3-phosphate dehydrogenase [Cyanobacteria bacterium UBA11166]HBR77083.1 NAD(P)H-dependent glycerol-3-phosphate dehydrogenase [Cyanobacteria bacterium UBA11159]HBS68205.1 NAD(P)H-dependent glycerol-3-phosphate dehydrogenase [Cyanobacteria bacterium UBA11153]HBW90349.1 NAD(P
MNITEQIPHQPTTLAILGAGAWGSALTSLAQRNGHKVLLWSRSGALSLEDALANVEMVVSAIPMKGVATTVAKIKELGLREDIIIVTATKGLDTVTTRTPSQIWHSNFPHHPIVVLSGPNLSKEIEQGLPTATVVASHDASAAQAVQTVFSSDRFRVYTNTDPLGTELGGTLKNVIAIAVGVCDGLQLGTNAKSALITRALTEIIRIGTHLGGKTETFFGLSGLGDMLATCSSMLSRNYRVGYGLAQGKSLAEVLAELQSTAEGVNTANVLIQIANREEIYVPISWQVYRLLNKEITPQEAVEALLERDLKSEN